jgi:hypothetical protein
LRRRAMRLSASFMRDALSPLYARL